VRERLSDLEIQRALGTLPGWSRRGTVLTKTYTLKTFPDVIALVGRIATEAERMNHHPDLDIRYNKLVCTLSTHDAGGITKNDLALAAKIEELA
jgi:4a-hydroxytetrahydrobiopterin dehydratase